MRNLLSGVLAGALLILGMSANAAVPSKKKKATTSRKTTASAVRKPAVKKNTSRKPSPVKASASTSTRKGKSTGKTTTASSKRGKKPAAPKTTWRNRQTTPSADRYREIQQALATKGYLTAEQSTGAWDQTSISALKRFQQEQSLEPSGKINSLSLIALGLGPRREAMLPSTVNPTATTAPANTANSGITAVPEDTLQR